MRDHNGRKQTKDYGLAMRDELQFFRRFTLLQHLPMQMRGKRSVEQLLQALNRAGMDSTSRTVQRDLIWLSRLFPIQSDQGTPRGWYWTGSSHVDVPALDSLEALVLLMGYESLYMVLPKALTEDWDGYQRRAQQALAHSPLAGWRHRVVVLSSPIQRPPQLSPAVLLRTLESLEARKQIRFQYQAPGRKDTKEHTLSLWGLVLHDGVLYLVGVTDTIREPMIFAAHRSRSMEILTEAAILRPSTFSLEDFARASLQFQHPGSRLSLQLQVDKAIVHLIQERPISEKQQVLCRGRRWCDVRAEVDDSQALRWWILSFGAAMRVVAPLTLFEELRTITQDMAHLYRRRPPHAESQDAI